MKKLCFLLLMSWVVMDVTAQHVVYSNLKVLVRMIPCANT